MGVVAWACVSVCARCALTGAEQGERTHVEGGCSCWGSGTTNLLVAQDSSIAVLPRSRLNRHVAAKYNAAWKLDVANKKS